jgi:TPR repeat protein
MGDPAKRADYFRRGADAGTIEGCWAYGVTLLDGTGVAQDCDMAVRYFEHAVQAGNAEAMHWFGVCLKNRTGVKKDVQRGMQLIRQAAQANHPSAILEYARCPRAGDEVPRELELVAHYDGLAAAL